MKKVLMIAMALMFVAGSLSGATYVGMFSSQTSNTAADVSVTAAMSGFYYIYFWVDPETNFKGLECGLVSSGVPSDMKLSVTYIIPAIAAKEDPFGVDGWSMALTGTGCITDVTCFASIWVMNMSPLAHTITMGPSPLTGYLKFIDCDMNELPVSVNTIFGVNTDGTPTEESSWGAVKSMYR